MDLVKDLHNNGKLYRLSMDPSGIDISGENQILKINSDKITGNLNVDGDLSLNGDLSMNGDVFIDGDLSLNGGLEVYNGKIGIGKKADTIYNLDIIGAINCTAGVFVNNSSLAAGTGEPIVAKGMAVQIKHTDYKEKVKRVGTGWQAIDSRDDGNGFVVKITPKSIQSKVLISTVVHISIGSASANPRWYGIKLYRKIGNGSWDEVIGANGEDDNTTLNGGSSTSVGTRVWFSNNQGMLSSNNAYAEYFLIGNSTASYLDSPGTTEEVMYTLYWNSSFNQNQQQVLYLNQAGVHDAHRPTTTSSLSATEIWDDSTPYNPTDSAIMIDTDADYVGIGTAAPATGLDVQVDTSFNKNVSISGGDFNIYDNNGNSSFSIKQNYISITTSHVQNANQASSFYTESTTYGVQKVSDGNSNTLWECANGNYTSGGAPTSSAAKTWAVYDYNGANTEIVGEWVQLEYTNPAIIDSITISTIASQSGYNAEDLTVLGSNTASADTDVSPPVWFVLCKILTLKTDTDNQLFDIPHTNFGTEIDGPNSSKITPYYHILKPFKYIRFIVTESRGKYANINEIDITFANTFSSSVMSMATIPVLNSNNINGNKVSASSVLLTSDSRIKNDIKLVDDTKAIDLVNTLESKEYGYIDPYNRKTQKTIGFIAQEVKDVLPNAVTIEKGFIPDEIREIVNPVWNVDSNECWTLTISDILFQVNHTGKCRFYLGETKKDIQVESDQVSFKFDKKYDSVYLWGKEINDFHMIDKNQIFALHHSAIQELDRKHKREVEEKNNEITKLRSEVNSLTSRMEALEASFLALQNN